MDDWFLIKLMVGVLLIGLLSIVAFATLFEIQNEEYCKSIGYEGSTFRNTQRYCQQKINGEIELLPIYCEGFGNCYKIKKAVEK